MDIVSLLLSLSKTNAVKKSIVESHAVSGDSVVLDNGDGGIIKSLISHINPVQTGSGTPSPDNVRPITGFTGVMLYTAQKDDPEGGYYTTLSWEEDEHSPGEIFGGFYDWVNGRLIVTYDNIESYNGEEINEPWLSSMDEYAPGTTPTTGAQVVYPLSEADYWDYYPETVFDTYLMPGGTIMSSDTGDTDVDYFSGEATEAVNAGIKNYSNYVTGQNQLLYEAIDELDENVDSQLRDVYIDIGDLFSALYDIPGVSDVKDWAGGLNKGVYFAAFGSTTDYRPSGVSYGSLLAIVYGEQGGNASIYAMAGGGRVFRAGYNGGTWVDWKEFTLT